MQAYSAPAPARMDDAPRHEEPPVARAPAVPPAPPAAFHEVSEHDAVAAEAHRPVRKRRHADAEPQAEVPLQMVETQAETAPMPIEDELPRRTKPRRRRSVAAENVPLQMVETQASTDQPGETPTP